MGDTLTPDHRFDAWFEPHTLDKRLAGGEAPLGCYKQFLQQGQERLKRRFEEGTGVPLLLRARSWLVDQVLQRVWREIMADHRMAASLIAVGGYGRSELMPGSDIDLLLLLPDADNTTLNASLEQLLMFLWDIGLEVGHSVRSIDECVTQSLADISVATNIMEARQLAGSTGLL